VETPVSVKAIHAINLPVVLVMVKTYSLPEDFEELEVVGKFSI